MPLEAEHNPKAIAIVGASRDPAKYGNKAVRGYQMKHWTVYPVNPKATTVEGLTAYASVTDIPDEVDVASVYLPPEVSFQILPELAAKGIRRVFFNPGAADDAVLARAQELGLEAVSACSLLTIGVNPDSL